MNLKSRQPQTKPKGQTPDGRTEFGKIKRLVETKAIALGLTASLQESDRPLKVEEEFKFPRDTRKLKVEEDVKFPPRDPRKLKVEKDVKFPRDTRKLADIPIGKENLELSKLISIGYYKNNNCKNLYGIRTGGNETYEQQILAAKVLAGMHGLINSGGIEALVRANAEIAIIKMEIEIFRATIDALSNMGARSSYGCNSKSVMEE